MASKKKTSPAKTIIISLLALIIGVIVGFVGSNIYLSYELEFYLNGDVETNVALGSTYEEEGAVCIFRGVDYSSELEITYYNDMMQEVNTVDTTSLTKYYVSYKIDNSKITSTLNRVIVVVEFEDLEINFMMLGNKYAGDCIYIKAGDTDILVDAGSRKNSAPVIKEYLFDKNSDFHNYVEDSKLEYVIVSHADQDHIAAFVGSDGIFNDSSIEIETIIEFPKTNKTTALYKEYRAAVEKLEANGTKKYTALECYNNENGASRIIEVAAGIEIEILYNYYYEHETDNENNYSVCFMLRRGSQQFLFTGDLENEGKAEEYLVQNNNLGEVYLYKMGHHGSKTSSSEALLSVIKPEVAVATCVAFTTEYTDNTDNTFPTKAAVDNLVKYNVKHLYVPYMVSDNKDGFEVANGNILVYANSSGTGVKCSASNEDFYNFEIFKKYRSWSSN